MRNRIRTAAVPLRKGIWLFGLWVCFAFGLHATAVIVVVLCFVAVFIGPLHPLATANGYLQNFIESADRMCAAALGFSGRLTLSTELAFPQSKWWLVGIQIGLETIRPGHCRDSAMRENAYCRVKDRSLRGK